MTTLNRIGYLIVLAIVSGCAATYQAQEVTDQYSDPNKPRMVAMKGNAIDYRDPLNAVPVSELNAYVERDRQTGAVVSVGFSLVFVSKNGRWIAIRPGDEMVFLCGGQRVAMKASAARIDQNVANLGSLGLAVDRFDYATYPATVEQFKTIASSQCTGIKVNGSTFAHEFPRRDLGFLSSFLPNIAQFYQTEIAPFSK